MRRLALLLSLLCFTVCLAPAAMAKSKAKDKEKDQQSEEVPAADDAPPVNRFEGMTVDQLWATIPPPTPKDMKRIPDNLDVKYDRFEKLYFMHAETEALGLTYYYSPDGGGFFIAAFETFGRGTSGMGLRRIVLKSDAVEFPIDLEPGEANLKVISTGGMYPSPEDHERVALVVDDGNFGEADHRLPLRAIFEAFFSKELEVRFEGIEDTREPSISAREMQDFRDLLLYAGWLHSGVMQVDADGEIKADAEHD